MSIPVISPAQGTDAGDLPSTSRVVSREQQQTEPFTTILTQRHGQQEPSQDTSQEATSYGKSPTGASLSPGESEHSGDHDSLQILQAYSVVAALLATPTTPQSPTTPAAPVIAGQRTGISGDLVGTSHIGHAAQTDAQGTMTLVRHDVTGAQLAQRTPVLDEGASDVAPLVVPNAPQPDSGVVDAAGQPGVTTSTDVTDGSVPPETDVIAAPVATAQIEATNLGVAVQTANTTQAGTTMVVSAGDSATLASGNTVDTGTTPPIIHVLRHPATQPVEAEGVDTTTMTHLTGRVPASETNTVAAQWTTNTEVIIGTVLRGTVPDNPPFQLPSAVQGDQPVAQPMVVPERGVLADTPIGDAPAVSTEADTDAHGQVVHMRGPVQQDAPAQGARRTSQPGLILPQQVVGVPLRSGAVGGTETTVGDSGTRVDGARPSADAQMVMTRASHMPHALSGGAQDHDADGGHPQHSSEQATEAKTVDTSIDRLSITPAGRVEPAPSEQVPGASDGELSPTTLAQRIVDRIREHAVTSPMSIHLRLDTETHGQVDVRVIHRNGAIQVHLIAADPHARTALETGLDHLRRGLVDSGFSVQRVDVTAPTAASEMAGGGRQDLMGFQQQSGRQWSAPHQFSAARSATVISERIDPADATLLMPRSGGEVSTRGVDYRA